MNVNVQISLGQGENAADLAGSATELAQKILRTVGGDPEKDMASVVITDAGMAGSMPQPTPLP